MVDQPFREWAAPRAWILGTAVAVGVPFGLLGTLGLSLADGSRGPRTTVFAVGALLLGIGMLGWSGSIVAGHGIENMQRYLDTNSDWTERNSRRAMTRIGGFGFGMMIGASLVPDL